MGVSLCLAEGLLVLAGYSYSPLKIVSRADPNDRRFEHVFQDPEFVFDPALLWRPRKAYGSFNAQGYRGRDVGPGKAPGTVRILAVGDSNTLGHHGTTGANWPILMEQLDRRLVVINAGVYGYSSFQGLRRLSQALSLNPDLVLISFGGNDAHPVYLSDAEYAAALSRRLGLLGSFARWRVGQLLLDAADKGLAPRREAGKRVPRVSLPQYRANLEEMIGLCRVHDARPVLLTRPYLGRSNDPDSWKTYARAYNEATREVGEKEDVLCVDVFKEFRQRRDLFEDESHFSTVGHWTAAQYIYGRIQGLLEGPPAR